MCKFGFQILISDHNILCVGIIHYRLYLIEARLVITSIIVHGKILFFGKLPFQSSRRHEVNI
ncbi:hypothetical protein D3C73_733140 [compost metagenome]